jgi:hypothetical protein
MAPGIRGTVIAFPVGEAGDDIRRRARILYPEASCAKQ